MGSKGTLIVAVIGIIGIAAVAIIMVVFLDQLERSPSGAGVKLGLELADKYKVEGVRIVKVIRGPGNCVLMVNYRTDRVPTVPDGSRAEMTDVAKFAFEKYPAEERRVIRKVEVTRTQERSAGCWKSKTEGSISWDPPAAPPIRDVPRGIIIPPK